MVSASSYVPATLPSGNFVVGTLVDETIGISGYSPSSMSAAEVLLLTNGAPVINAAVTMVDSTASISYVIPYSGSVTANGHGLAGYINSSITYTPGDSYSLSVSFPGSTTNVTSSTLVAPGPIAFSSDGSSVTCTDLGSFQVAMVVRDLPAPSTLTYNSTNPSNLGSPFTFPSSAFSTPSSPATFTSVYAAAATVYSFTGPSPASGNAFVAMDFYEDEVTR
jgi:hypothetical protein